MSVAPPGARSSPSTARNREPILAVLKSCLPPAGLVLEIAAGAGEHAVFMAAAMAPLIWRPTDPDPLALTSIAAWRDHAALPNLLAPLRIDAADPDSWPVAQADAVVNINMIHISPWMATVGLMTGAGRILRRDGVLFLYGPYVEDEVATAPGNLAFDAGLKARNSDWGLRRREDVVYLAAEHGFAFTRRVVMPANNLALIFRRT